MSIERPETIEELRAALGKAGLYCLKIEEIVAGCALISFLRCLHPADSVSLRSPWRGWDWFRLDDLKKCQPGVAGVREEGRALLPLAKLGDAARHAIEAAFSEREMVRQERAALRQELLAARTDCDARWRAEEKRINEKWGSGQLSDRELRAAARIHRLLGEEGGMDKGQGEGVRDKGQGASPEPEARHGRDARATLKPEAHGMP